MSYARVYVSLLRIYASIHLCSLGDIRTSMKTTGTVELPQGGETQLQKGHLDGKPCLPTRLQSVIYSPLSSSINLISQLGLDAYKRELSTSIGVPSSSTFFLLNIHLLYKC